MRKQIAAVMVMAAALAAGQGMMEAYIEAPPTGAIVASLDGQVERWRGEVADGLVDGAKGVAGAAVRTAPRMALISSRLLAMGFSMTTCFPDSAAAIVFSA